MIIPPTWTIPDAIRARLGATTYGRQRAIVEEGQLLLILHKPPGPDDTEREGVLFWRNANGDWQSNKSGPGTGSLRRHIQQFEELETQLMKAYEEAPDTTALFNLIEALTPLARASHHQFEALQAAREASKQDAFLIEARDLAYEVDRNLGLLLEDVRNAIQYRNARESEEQARLGREALHASHRLNTLAAFFLPMTAFASLFSMNFYHGLNERQPGLFWLIFLAGLGLGYGVKTWVLAKSDSAKPPRP